MANHFEEKTLSSKISLRRQLYDAKLESSGDMVAHINHVKAIADRLEALDDTQSEKDLVYILMSSVPSEYRALITTLGTLKEDQLKWDYVRDRMITEYGRIKGSAKDVEDTCNHDQPQDAFYVGDRQHKDFKKCYYCD